MSAQRRITRKEMKQDKLVTTAFRVSDYVQENKPIFIIGLIVIIAIGAGVWWYNYSVEQKRAQSVAEIGKGDIAAMMGDAEGAIEYYLETIENYGSTINGQKAYIYLGRIYNDTGEYDKARAIYQEYLDKFGEKGPDLLVRSAINGMAVALRGLKDYILAADYYLKAVEMSTSSEEKAYLLLDAARCYKAAKDKENALMVYERIQEEHPLSLQRTAANKEIEEVKRMN
ncbi:MAG: tetratricopeptide repeat protein [candidate division Zixibacteria bacterium]|nr:tetratricopeptide repeat protein [candidate division Zixibacteria bacterium]